MRVSIVAQPMPVRPRSQPWQQLALRWLRSTPVAATLFFLAHVALALVMRQTPLVATAHAGVVLAVGLWWAATARGLERVAYLCAYLAGAEVLWRMNDARVFWEYGKYATVAILVIALLRAQWLKIPVLPMAYFLLLLPSAVLPMADVQSDVLWQQLSFNMSGPLSLLVCLWFFGYLKLTRAQLQRVAIALIAPVVGLATITLFSTVTAREIKFTNNSNYVTSAGFGPNQTSAMLGLGALLALLTALAASSRGLRLLLYGVSLLLATQSALTFSRTGVYTALGALMAASFYLLRSSRTRWKLLAGAAGLALVGVFFLWPRLESFTEGALGRRFQNTRTTGRETMMQDDLRVWWENPVFGVGPGQARFHRQGLYYQSAAHTEFTRLLAEHGSFGLAAVLILLLIGLQHLRQAPTAGDKAFALALLAWSALFMLSTGMRLVAPALMFGLTAVKLLPERRP